MRLVILMLILICSTSVFAVSKTELQLQRLDAVKEYVRLLGRGDYQSMPQLFTKHAVAVSASGDSDTIDHFYETLFSKTMMSPRSRLINIFNGQLKNNMMTAYYNLTWHNASGVLESAKFVDLIIFQPETTKIITVYVFSNRFHEDVLMPQKPSIALAG